MKYPLLFSASVLFALPVWSHSAAPSVATTVVLTLVVAIDSTKQSFKFKQMLAPESVDFNYLLKFCQVYHTARLIANRRQVPFWEAGDVYEKVGKAPLRKTKM